MTKYIYTIEDWKNGVIHEDFIKGRLPEVVYKEVKNIGYLNDLMLRENLVSKEDHLLIEAVMRETFFKILEHNVEQRINFFVSKLEQAYRPDLLLSERIDELQRKIDTADNYYKEQAFRGEWNKTGIDYEVFRKVNDEDFKKNHISLIQFTPINKFKNRLGGFHQVFTNQYYLWQNVVFDVSEILRFQEKLILLKGNGVFEKGKKDRRKDGEHKENELWVQQNFDELRPESKSDNQAVEKIRDKYQENFGKKIGKSTVQRFVGLINR